MKLSQIAVCVAAVLLAAIENHAVAEPTRERGDSVRSLQEVSVTAIKSASGTAVGQPVAVTVVGEKELSRLNIVTMKQVSDVAPNFYVPDYGSRMTSSIYVRGLGARIDQPVVGLNVDNVPVLNKDNYDFDLVDIERIEVMRGPQSTLYGRNTMGGVVNIRTLSPMNWQGFRFLVGYGSANTARAAVSYYTRIRASLGMSWAADFSRTDGFFCNMYNGRKADKERQGSVRWKTAWRAAPSVMLENVFSANVTRQGGYPYQSVASGEINYNDTCFYRRTGLADGVTLKWITDRFVLSGITSVQYLDDNMTLDQDFTPSDYFTLSQLRKEWAVTQDVVAKDAGGGRYGWLAGIFGFYKHTRMDAPVLFKDYGIKSLIEENRNEANPYYPIAWNDDRFLLGSHFVMPVWGLAVYHQSTLAMDRWTLTAGVRVDYERASLDYHSRCGTSYTTWNCTGDIPVPQHQVNVDIDDGGRLDKSFVEIMPKFSISNALPVSEPSPVYSDGAKGDKS
ncbi:MAG: TonB-dependent receptor plug domain-containing protein, partial [Muribaculaceae bacterium]|nr:TonB-dependent receptor plug domain-containing protein [Muribaculaceae bacterium]